MKHFVATIMILSTIFFTVTPMMAQDTTVHKKDWHYLGELYLMFPNMKGQTTVGNLPEVEVDADAATILGKLKGGAMLYLEASNNDWSITSDFIYMKLEQELDSTLLVQSGLITMEQLAWELAVLKRITPWLEGGIGGRLVVLDVGIDMIGALGNARDGSGSVSWYDPIIILRSQTLLKDKWILQLRGDVGGFGIGSDFSWQVQANAGYRFSKLFQATLGYRYIGIDYDSGEGSDRFLYDIDTYGWVTRLGFNF